MKSRISAIPTILFIGRIIGYFAVYACAAYILNRPAFPSLSEWYRGVGVFFFSVHAGAVHLTVVRWVFVYVCAAIPAILIGLIAGYAKPVARFVAADLDFWRSLPATCLFFFVVAAFGDNVATRVMPAFYVTFFTVAYYTIKAVTRVEASRIEHLLDLGASNMFIFRHCILYEIADWMFVGLRQSISLSFLVLVSTEFVTGSADNRGLGTYLNDWFTYSRYELVLTALVVLGVIGYVVNRFMYVIHKRCVFWVPVEH